MWWWSLAWAGSPVGSPIDGWTVTAPDGWRAVQQDGAWVLAAEGRPGMVLLTYTSGSTYSDLKAQAALPMQDGPMVLAPVSSPVARQAGASKAVAADYQGRAPDGAALGAHAVGVAGPAGGLVVVGMAPADALPALAAVVDAVAASTTWTSVGPGDVALLTGVMCGGLASVRMTFDGVGRVASESPLAAAGAGGTYRVAGDEVVVAFPDGSERRCRATARDGARITALECGGKPWSPELCR